MWIVGQRVLAEFEPELGLGLVVNVVGTRLIEVLFPGAELTRRYSQAGPPLRRLVLAAGQRARAKGGETFTVAEVREVNGLYQYRGEGCAVWEYELDHVIEDLNPLAHLLMGRWRHPKSFTLREQAWELKGKSLASGVPGLVGPRVSLLPHQIYIAHEIAHREFPRVLLADEVGLGKTIEAGLIFSALKALGRAGRVLVLAPESLKHQWLAEMFRRFSEMFSIVDEERSEEEEGSQGKSAFQMNQKIICSFDFLLENPQRLEEAVQEPWDLLIIDEAHHLQWSVEDPSPQWEVAQLIAAHARGLLLLTATPEHEGSETEFGLLHLVDPERFPDFAKFQKEQKHVKVTAHLARDVQAGERSPELVAALKKLAGDDADLKATAEAYVNGGSPDALLRSLIDRHGTGRVLIRNRRSRLKGFPERRLQLHELSPPVAWREHLVELDPAEMEVETLLRLASGQLKTFRGAARQAWFHARAQWLLGLLKGIGGEKVLLIGSSAKGALELQSWLRTESSIRTGVFHEGLEIVERDRQAAWFAQSGGAQVLICSEIGGEGRNFQFAHHLVLFDMPLHPDVLEQRIGRLDRIGQSEAIQIHLPFLEDTPEEALARWFAEGLGSFEEPWIGGAGIESLHEPLLDALKSFLPRSPDHDRRARKLEKVLEKTREKVEAMRTKSRESLDVLVDLNSFDETRGKALVERLHAIDEGAELRDFMEKAFDHFGVETEEFDEDGTLKVSTHSLTFVESFPGISAHGERLITYDRAHALAREELAFLSWDHPIAQGALGLVLEGETGQASVASWPECPQPAIFDKSPIIIELLYVLQATAPVSLGVEHDLPLKPLKLFIGLDGKPVPEPKGLTEATLKPVLPQRLAPIMEGLRERLPNAIEKANDEMVRRATKLIEEASARRERRMGEEHARLVQLSRVNPLISKREIKEHATKIAAGLEALRSARPRLEAIRLILKA